MIMLAGKELDFLDALKVSGAGIMVVMLELALLAIFVFLLSKSVRFFLQRTENKRIAVNNAPAEHQPAAVTESAVAMPLLSHGELELVETDEATAAVIMAIVSNKTSIPLNRLKFIRIRLLEEQQ